MSRHLRTVLMVLVGCALGFSASCRPVILPSGEKGYSVRCDNETMNACYEKAGDVCHRGYEIKTENKESGFEGNSSAFVYGAAGSADSKVKSTSEKGFLITCKESELTERERNETEAKIESQQLAEEKERSIGAGYFIGTVFVILGTFLILASFK